jgi:hypothetical protein
MFYFALLQILMKQQMSNFLTYRAENFESIINTAEEIANILDVDPVFPKIPKKKKKIKFDYEANDEQINNPKDKKNNEVCRKAAHKQPIFSCT